MIFQLYGVAEAKGMWSQLQFEFWMWTFWAGGTLECVNLPFLIRLPRHREPPLMVPE